MSQTDPSTRVDGPEPESEIVRPLNVGLIADTEGVQRLAAVLADPAIKLVAQSGKRTAESLPKVPWHDDARAMIAQSGIEALVLATSPKLAFDVDALAADYHLPVWRLPPLARNFAEATELVRRCGQRPTVYRVASWWDAIGADMNWALERPEEFKPLYSEVRVSAAGPELQSWRSSAALSPGGVLATDAYGLLEALVAVRKLPERVFACRASVRRKPGAVPRETEDALVAVLRYESGSTALVRATWDVLPFGQMMEHHGADCSITLEPGRIVIRTIEGELVDQRGLATESYLVDELHQFVAAVRNGGREAPLDSTLERHVAVTALLEAIYLSARTGQPESPRKFYEVQSWPEPRL